MKRTKQTLKIVFRISPAEEASKWVYFAKKKSGLYGRSVTLFTHDIPAEIRPRLRRLPRSRAKALAVRYVTDRMTLFKRDLTSTQYLLDRFFSKNGNAMLRDVARMTGRAMYADRFYAYFTLLGICPYDYAKRSFMVSVRQNMPKQLTTVCHEIMHFQFIHHYRRYCIEHGLTEKQFQDLKEAMTVLLNQRTFRKYPMAIDRGYDAHQPLRKELERLWRRKHSYREFLDRSIVATMKCLPA